MRWSGRKIGMRRNDDVVRVTLCVIQQAVESVCACGIGNHSPHNRAVRPLQRDLHSVHAAVVAHHYTAAYLAVRRAPAFCRSIIAGELAVAVVQRGDNIFIMHVGYCRVVEERVLRAGINGVCHRVAVLHAALQYITIHCRGRRCPVEQHAAFQFRMRVSLRSDERSNLCTLVEIEFGTIDWHGFELALGIPQTQVGMGLVYAHSIAVMGAGTVCHVHSQTINDAR